MVNKMKCPHCGNELAFPIRAYSNMRRYWKVTTVVTECCGKMVRLIPRFDFEAVKSDVEVDDWGNEVNRKAN